MNGFVDSAPDRFPKVGLGRLRERTGGPRNPPPREPRRGSRSIDAATANGLAITAGSHMPLDTVLHWNWRNPLNLLPLLIVLALLLALVALVL